MDAMPRRPRITVIQVPPYRPDRAAGGAEVVAGVAVAAFAEVGDVTVICCAGCVDTDDLTPSTSASRPRRVYGLRLTDEEAEAAVVSARYSEAASRAIGESDLVVCIERVLAQTPSCPVIVLLGGWAYPHCRIVAESDQWDWMAVPSRDVKAALGLDANPRVKVIENALDPIFLESSSVTERLVPGPTRVLFASRPTMEKGVFSAIAAVEAMRSMGVDATLTYIASEVAGFGSCDDFIPEAPWLERIPWQARDAMPDLYQAHDVTMCLSSIPEGFGLVAAESLACGTPVVATDAGHLAHLAGPSDGMFHVPMGASAETVAERAVHAAQLKADGAIKTGAVVTSSISDMRRAYRDLAVRAIANREPERSGDVL